MGAFRKIAFGKKIAYGTLLSAGFVGGVYISQHVSQHLQFRQDKTSEGTVFTASYTMFSLSQNTDAQENAKKIESDQKSHNGGNSKGSK